MSTISYDPITAQSPPPGEVSFLMMSWQNDMAHFESELDTLEEASKMQFSFKVLKSSYAQEVDDFEKGRRVFNDSILAIQRSSITNNDTAAKAVKMLSCVWHSSIISGQSPPQLTVQSRFGASLRQDFIRTWRKEFGAIPQGRSGPSDGALSQEPFVANVQETFQDEMMFNLDFLDDRAWTSALNEVPLFRGSTT
ncbi:uncharacterized protein K444DRAFT_632532 [Hyaloscypha bicolor E]|uniref:Uncharacterized protein n=1 Tax=Hyaloscypha bicolor E TaxID=1095630 RepID=A0A2J6T350_9HELO|nr:uncharacterized protein K444DRAFT_632532 [Hyaloscypha bicolor E]PMD57437.1 hypothetical protein K444DRAFT_632532 [Hyaloscypha bicolor E]